MPHSYPAAPQPARAGRPAPRSLAGRLLLLLALLLPLAGRAQTTPPA